MSFINVVFCNNFRKCKFKATLNGTPSSLILMFGSGVITLRAEKSTRLPIRFPLIRPSFPLRRCLSVLSALPERWADGLIPGSSLSTSVAT